MNIGFIGLGTMGMPMAKNLLANGYSLTVFNRNQGRSHQLFELGAEVGASPAEVAMNSDVLITMLSTDDAVTEVCFSDNGIAAGARKGLVVIDCSTVSSVTSRANFDKFAELGVSFLDAPVTGSEPEAINGALTFLVGGSYEVFETCKPILNILGKSIFYMGQSGSGSYTKIANNLMVAINMLAFSEGLTMAQRSGIDPEMFVNVISLGAARNGMVATKAHKILANDFHPNFSLKLMAKDLVLAANQAREIGLPVPGLGLVQQMLQIAISEGYGDEDVCALVKCYEGWA